jgi:hypothetical protein
MRKWGSFMGAGLAFALMKASDNNYRAIFLLAAGVLAGAACKLACRLLCINAGSLCGDCAGSPGMPVQGITSYSA